MPEPGYLLSAVVVSAAITWALRAVPFAVLAPLRRSAVIAYLGRSMPVGVMAILVVYTLRHLPFGVPPFGAPVALALAATVALHLWLRNVVVSIIGGTLVHVVLATLVFGS